MADEAVALWPVLSQLQERARLVRPCSDEAARELALADRLAERDKNLPEAEIRRLLGEEIEAIRAEAIAKGAAIDDPIEAVVDD